jgi:hypothetical protein
MVGENGETSANPLLRMSPAYYQFHLLAPAAVFCRLAESEFYVARRETHKAAKWAHSSPAAHTLAGR